VGLYSFAQKVGLSSILRGHLTIGLKRLLLPVPYWRFRIFKDVIRLVPPGRQLSILDIGSPKLLALYLAIEKGHKVFATDIQDTAIFSMWQCYFEDYCGKWPGGKYITEFQDARSLTYHDDCFDFIYSISVLEHIAGDGDAQAMREIHRTLKKGGVAVIEVPYALKGYESHHKQDVYERKFTGDPLFYQRHYDDVSLKTRLVEPSGMIVRDHYVLGERLPFEQTYAKLPVAAQLPFLPFEATIASLNHFVMTKRDIERDHRRHYKRAMSATLVLTKP